MKILLLLALVALIGCSPERKEKSRVAFYTEYKVVGKTRPKHFYVDLLDVKTGQLYKHVYVSKHFNGHETQVPIGRIVLLTNTITIYEDGGSNYQFYNLYDTLQQKR